MKTKLSKLLKSHFNRLPRHVFGPNEISQFLAQHRQEWGVSAVSIQQLLDILLQQKLVTRAEFKSTKYGTIVRYLRGEHSTLELALSLQRDSFLSHGTALTVHGIAGPANIVYVNREQSPKDRSNGITQAGMALAFRNKQRQSKYIFHHSAVKYMLLNGKHTGRAGVTRTKTPSGETVEATDKERTLIDVVVRPAYAGGIERVADAYERSASGIDVDHMIDLLQRLGHAYPYHQAVGFLLERAGRPNADCQKFEAFGKEFDFYLDYGMKRPAFNKKWRLHYPASLD
jgi:predicted transcriptional regulator of viral defense system